MRVGVLTHTTVSDGQRARAASSVVYWPACRAEGAPTFDAGAEEGADCCHHGNREPDWEAERALGQGPARERNLPRTQRRSLGACGIATETAASSGRRSFLRPWRLSIGSRIVFMTLWPAAGAPTFDAAQKLAPTAATMGIGSLTEGQALARPSTKTARGLRPGAYGTAPETAASSGRRSFPPPEPASIRLRKFS